MVWNLPAPTVTGQLMTSAFWNAQVRDNMLESSAATALVAGDLVYADAANSMGTRIPIGSAGTRLASTGSAPVWRDSGGMIGDATYTAASPFPTAFTTLSNALWGSGNSVEVTLETGVEALVWFGARFVNHPTLGSNIQLSYDVLASGIAASNTWGTADESDPAGTLASAGRGHFRTGLTPGNNTFRLVALCSTAAAGVLSSPWIVVEAL